MTERVKLTEREVLFMCAASCQGGNSEAGAAAAEVLGVPFPIRMEDLEAQAKREKLEPRKIWPWLFRLRDAERFNIAPSDYLASPDCIYEQCQDAKCHSAGHCLAAEPKKRTETSCFWPRCECDNGICTRRGQT